MKMTFDGPTLADIIDQMRSVIAASHEYRKIAEAKAQGPGPEPKDKKVYPGEIPGEIPVEKKARTEKQLANDERLKAAALAKKAAGTMFKKAAAPELAQPSAKQPEPEPEASPFAEPEPEAVDPAEMVKVREKTLAELRAAFGNGHHKEVMVLLARYGNGAKSFRELPPEAFQPIRAAIDNGALE